MPLYQANIISATESQVLNKSGQPYTALVIVYNSAGKLMNKSIHAGNLKRNNPALATKILNLKAGQDVQLHMEKNDAGFNDLKDVILEGEAAPAGAASTPATSTSTRSSSYTYKPDAERDKSIKRQLSLKVAATVMSPTLKHGDRIELSHLFAIAEKIEAYLNNTTATPALPAPAPIKPQGASIEDLLDDTDQF